MYLRITITIYISIVRTKFFSGLTHLLAHRQHHDRQHHHYTLLRELMLHIARGMTLTALYTAAADSLFSIKRDAENFVLPLSNCLHTHTNRSIFPSSQKKNRQPIAFAHSYFCVFFKCRKFIKIIFDFFFFRTNFFFRRKFFVVKIFPFVFSFESNFLFNGFCNSGSRYFCVKQLLQQRENSNRGNFLKCTCTSNKKYRIKLSIKLCLRKRKRKVNSKFIFLMI